MISFRLFFYRKKEEYHRDFFASKAFLISLLSTLDQQSRSFHCYAGLRILQTQVKL